MRRRLTRLRGPLEDWPLRSRDTKLCPLGTVLPSATCWGVLSTLSALPVVNSWRRREPRFSQIVCKIPLSYSKYSAHTSKTLNQWGRNLSAVNPMSHGLQTPSIELNCVPLTSGDFKHILPPPTLVVTVQSLCEICRVCAQTPVSQIPIRSSLAFYQTPSTWYLTPALP